MKWIVGGVLAAIVGFVGYLMLYLGAFRSVQLSDGPVPAMTLIGKEHVGPYHKIVPVIQEVETWAKEAGLDCTRSFGLYLDDPEEVDEPRLKSFGGCVLADAKVPELPEGLSVRVFSAPHFVKALFEGSPGIGPFKVYPRVKEYIHAKGFHPLPSVLEVYIVHSAKAMTTTYYFPVEQVQAAAQAAPANTNTAKDAAPPKLEVKPIVGTTPTPPPPAKLPPSGGEPARTPVPGTVVPGGPSGVGP